MKPAETVSRSTLDKPLGELTEEDISQLTREDCRKYLKEKGMRRPSWNKSQAIQQVISLKTLLESRPESGDAGFRRKPVPIPESENPPNVESVSGTESASDRSKDPALSGDVSSPLPATECGPFPVENTTGISSSYRTTTEGPPVGQMTIFYDGKVNVYENVSPDKARLIMQLAASPNNCPSYEMPATASAGYQATRSFAGRLPSETVRTGPPSPPPLVVAAQQQTERIPQLSRESTDERKISHENECEGPTSRKASLQRYLEKRKDRFKNKRKTGASSSSSLEIYVNQQLRGGQISNGQSSRSGTCSPTQPNPPQTPARCSSVENQAKNLHLSVDLNDDDERL